MTNIEYSPTNLPVRITFHDGTAQERTYDAVGRLTEIREADNAQRITYDVIDRVTEAITDTQAGQTTLAYEYDALDRRTKRTVSFPGGTVETTTYTYDKTSRLKAITLNGPNGAHTTSYTWDAASRLTDKVLPNGIQQSFTYDAANRLTDLIYTRSDGTPIEHVRYEYDANGQRIAKGLSTGAVRETPIAATYDDANRMTSVTLFPGTPGAKTYTLTYDLHGNLEKKQNAADPAEQTIYAWDARNRLTSISASDAAGTRTADFKYDAMGRRIERTIVQSGVSQTTQYVYDGLQAIGELDGGNLAATTLTGLNIDEVLARTVNIATASAMNPIQTKSYITDALGSVLAMSHQDQTTQPYYACSPYGETQMLGTDPDIPNNPAQYTARENDGTIGGTNDQSLYYYRARYYDPVLKRFVSEDAIGLGGGANVYMYTRGGVPNWTDPLGRDIYTVHVGVSVPFVGGFDAGFMYNTGSGELNGLPDLGLFGTLKKNYAGLGRAKATWGISQTVGGRCEFDGTDVELHGGLGGVGASIGGFGDSNTPTSLGFDFGPQIGYGADLTQTSSFTIGDIARAIARLIHGPGGDPCICE